MKWQESSLTEIIDIYRAVLKKVQTVADQTLDRIHQRELQLDFMESLTLDGILDILERHSYKRLYLMFFYDWLFLDYRSDTDSPTMAELTLKNLAGTLDQLEIKALTNLVNSYVSPYRILSFRDGQGHLENLIIPRTNFNITMEFEGLMVGDVLVTRLLPGPRDWLLLEPWILLLPSNEKHLVKSLRLVTKKAGYRKRDINHFCKQKTLSLLQVINQEINEIEKEVVKMVQSMPFRPDWQEAIIDDSQRIMDFLHASDVFLEMEESGSGRFLFINRDNPGRLSWGYILVEEDRIAVCVPPKEDLTLVLDALIQAIAFSGDRLDFVKVGCSNERTDYYNDRMVEDLGEFLQHHEDMIDDLLIPHRYADFNQDHSRSDFFAKLSLRLGEQLQKKV